MPNVVLIDPRHARVAYTTVSPRYEDDEICRILQYELCRTCKFHHVRGWGLFSRMVRKPPPEHFRIIIAALPVDLLTIMDNQKCGLSEDR